MRHTATCPHTLCGDILGESEKLNPLSGNHSNHSLKQSSTHITPRHHGLDARSRLVRVVSTSEYIYKHLRDTKGLLPAFLFRVERSQCVLGALTTM